MQFQEILRELGVPYQTEGRYTRPGWVQFFCPFCTGGQDPNKPYAGYCISGNFITCWRCGHHRLLDTLASLTGRPIRLLKPLVAGLKPERLPDSFRPAGKLVLPAGVGPMLPAHKKYLRRRGYNPAELEQVWGVQGIGIAAKLSWRLFVPITYRGVVVSWTTRSLCSEGVRYISASAEQEAMEHKKLLYGEDYCHHSVIVVEGPTDAWRIGPGAVATLGTGYSRAQIRKLSKYRLRAICFDSESAAQKRARALCDQLEVYSGETYNVVLDSKDPGAADKSEVVELRTRFLT